MNRLFTENTLLEDVGSDVCQRLCSTHCATLEGGTVEAVAHHVEVSVLMYLYTKTYKRVARQSLVLICVWQFARIERRSHWLTLGIHHNHACTQGRH